MKWEVYGTPTENRKKFELLIRENKEVVSMYLLPIIKRSVFDKDALKMAHNAGKADLAKLILDIANKGEDE